jgi:hypothetical protein
MISKLRSITTVLLLPVALMTQKCGVQCFHVHRQYNSPFQKSMTTTGNIRTSFFTPVVRTVPEQMSEDNVNPINIITSTSTVTRYQQLANIRSRFVAAIMALYVWMKGPNILISEKNIASAMNIKGKVASTISVKELPAIVTSTIQATIEKCKYFVCNHRILVGSSVAFLAVGTVAVRNIMAKQKNRVNLDANNDTILNSTETTNMALLASSKESVSSVVDIETQPAVDVLPLEQINVKEEDSTIVEELVPELSLEVTSPISNVEITDDMKVDDIISTQTEINIFPEAFDSTEMSDFQSSEKEDDNVRLLDIVIAEEILGVVEEETNFTEEKEIKGSEEISSVTLSENIQEEKNESILNDADESEKNGHTTSDQLSSTPISQLMDDDLSEEDESNKSSTTSTTSRIKNFFKKSMMTSEESMTSTTTTKLGSELEQQQQQDSNYSTIALAVPTPKAVKKNVSSFFFGSEASNSRDSFAIARQQPKSRSDEKRLQAKYGAIESLEERAFQILADLGMVQIHTDLDDVGEWE